MEHKENKKPVYLSTFHKFKDEIEGRVDRINRALIISVIVDIIVIGMFSYLIFK